MARPSIIDKKKLPGLIKSGKTQKQIADIYGVTEASVSIAVKQLKIATGKAITLEVGHKVVRENLNILDQLVDINKVTRKIIDELTGEDHIIDDMVKAVQAVIDYEAEPTKDREKYLKAIIKKIIGEKNTVLKACDQNLKQLDFQVELIKTMYDLTEIEEFRRELIQILKETSPKLRNEFIRRLKQKKAAREGLTFPKLSSNL